ncbi:MAG: hypothetical protein R3B52_01750 [Candidatus Paceibacterota bacterium]
MKHKTKDFTPLIIMTLIVIALTVVGTSVWSIPAMQGFMGFSSSLFGALKVMRLKSFAQAYQMYDLIAMKSKAYALLYPFIEVGFGIAYISEWELRAVAVATIVVMLIGALGVYKKLRQKRKSSMRLSWHSI